MLFQASQPRWTTLLGILGVTHQQWNSTFFVFSFIIEGSTEKVFQFITAFKSKFTTKIFVSLNKKCILEQFTEIQRILNLLIDIIFVKKFLL